MEIQENSSRYHKASGEREFRQSETSRGGWPKPTFTENSGLARHVAIMLDGNRRWAKKNDLPSYRGHYQGAKSLKSLIEALSFSREPGVEFVTFWGGSLSNFSRPEKEVKVLFDVYAKYFAMMAKRRELNQYGIRVRILGGWQRIVPDKVKKVFQEIIEKTIKNKNLNLTFLIAYDGKEEMKSAISKIAHLAGQRFANGYGMARAFGAARANRKSQNKNLKITDELIKDSLWTKELPPVDLMIRTGVENDPHWSAGFMMWLCAESQFYFTKTLWPDFSAKEFKKALTIYAKTQRRFGR